MAQAYDFALDKMGMDFSSFTLWSDYILFLKNVDAAGSYAENQKISAIRKIYHRGIIIPMLNVESLWYAYNYLISLLLKEYLFLIPLHTQKRAFWFLTASTLICVKLLGRSVLFLFQYLRDEVVIFECILYLI